MFEVKIIACRPLKHPFPILSWLIMILQGMNPFRKDSFSHLAIAYKSQTGRWKVADCTSKGVRDRLWVNFCSDYKLIKMVETSSECDLVDFLNWYEDQEGLHYDKSQLFGLLLKSLNLITVNSFGKNWKALICSELVLSFYKNFKKIEINNPDDWDLIGTWELVWRKRK